MFFRVLVAFCLLASVVSAAELKLLLPLGRTAYQTNEVIDVAVVRSDAEFKAGPLKLLLDGPEGSRLGCTLEVPAARGRRTEHLHINGWLLRPGSYAVTVTCDGAKASAPFEVFSHLRRSDFRLINWGRADKEADQRVQGEDSLGYNLFYGGYGNDDQAHFLRAGVDFMANCVMSGGHQMDLRMECDWSDPYVTRGGTMRVVRRAMFDRTRPNVPGVHFYDEPGLTWHKHPGTGEFTPHGVPAQVRAFVSAFGVEPPDYSTIDPKKPEDVARWKQFAAWKLGFMDAAWKEAQFGVSAVRPDFLSVTQSQYGWSAFTDGYYFNVVRSLPITSGHGGYHDYGLGFFNPSYFLEMARARDPHPCWYLPTWYGNTTSDEFRLEQYLSFQTGVQGMMSPPDLEPARNASARQGIVETNQLFQRLGTIFTTMPPTKPPVSLLYSLSQCIHTQTLDRSQNYSHSIPHGTNLPIAYMAGKSLQHQFGVVLDEDILDGSLATHHKAVVLTSLDYLDPQVIAGLERFAAEGGLVLLTGDCTVQVKDSIKLAVVPKMPDQARIDELMKAQKYGELGPYQSVGKFYQAAAPLAAAIRKELEARKIAPVFECDVPSISASRHASGDIEYLFAVNATWNDGTPNERNGLKAVAATIALPDDGRPVYDAVAGGIEDSFKPLAAGKLVAKLTFGPGQMRVFMRPSRPLATGGRAFRVTSPVIHRDLLSEKEPIRVTANVISLDADGAPLTGSLPLRIILEDPTGRRRFDEFRATRDGVLALSFPMAVNDPPGPWTFIIQDTITQEHGGSRFPYSPPRIHSSVGLTPRAAFAVNDRENCFRFGRTHHDVALVCGRSEFNQAAAKRLTEILAPWGIRCRQVPLDEAAKSRPLTDQEAKTWVGLQYAASGQVKPGDANAPQIAGFNVPGPVILLGNPDDHPMLKYLQTERFLPYEPRPSEFPGQGRGMVCWQRDGIGRGQESIAVIAHDEAGMSEAVGSLYEAVAGLDPLTRWTLPVENIVQPAQAPGNSTPMADILWSVKLPDRVLQIVAGPNDSNRALTHDGSGCSFTPKGVEKVAPADPPELAAARKAEPKVDAAIVKAFARPDRMLKISAVEGDLVAVAYWGGTLRIGKPDGTVLAERKLPQDVTALAWSGKLLLAGLADGRVMALKVE